MGDEKGRLLDRMIERERASGDLYLGYVDRLINADYRARREDQERYGRPRSMSSVAAKAFSGYYKAASEHGISGHAELENAESPIEGILAFSLVRFLEERMRPERDLHFAEAVTAAKESPKQISVFQQVIFAAYEPDETFLGCYRLDFMVTVKTERGFKCLCIEADGREWHHNNVDQVSADYTRNAHLTACGVHTLRLTGRQIYRDTDASVELIRTVLRSWGAKELG